MGAWWKATGRSCCIKLLHLPWLWAPSHLFHYIPAWNEFYSTTYCVYWIFILTQDTFRIGFLIGTLTQAVWAFLVSYLLLWTINKIPGLHLRQVRKVVDKTQTVKKSYPSINVKKALPFFIYGRVRRMKRSAEIWRKWERYVRVTAAAGRFLYFLIGSNGVWWVLMGFDGFWWGEIMEKTYKCNEWPIHAADFFSIPDGIYFGNARQARRSAAIPPGPTQRRQHHTSTKQSWILQLRRLVNSELRKDDHFSFSSTLEIFQPFYFTSCRSDVKTIRKNPIWLIDWLSP